MTYAEAVEYRRSLPEDVRRDIDRMISPLVEYPVVELPLVVKDPYQHDDYEPGTRCVCGRYLLDGIFCSTCTPYSEEVFR